VVAEGFCRHAEPDHQLPASLFGQVVNQSPLPGKQEPFGQTVTLTVCAGLITVPDVTDDDASARNAITSAGLRVGTVTLTPDCTNPRGTVLSQDPNGGTQVRFGSSVSLNEATRSGRATHQIARRFCTQQEHGQPAQSRLRGGAPAH